MGRTLTGKTNKKRKVVSSSTKVNNKSGKYATKRGMDYTFLLIIVIMLCFGLIMVLSASNPAATSKFGNPYKLFSKQLITVCIGLVAMLVISKIDYKIWRKYAKVFMIVCTVLLVLVLIPGIGVLANNARRWIQLPGFQLQPSEFMKLAIGVYFADRIAKTGNKITKVTGLIPYFVWMGIIAVLMLKQPHLSGTIVILGIGVVVMIVGGAPFWFFCLGSLPVGAGVFALTMFSANKRARMISFLNPFEDIKNSGWQVVQSLYAIGSGGIFGLGLGMSRQKYTYLPEPYNDFIFSVICEELGLLGAIIVIMLFVAFIIRGIKIAIEAPDAFATLTVIGVVAQVTIQTILNIAVATSSIPNTGISLPFFSFGGTAIVILLAEMGLVLNISRYGRRTQKASK